MCVWSSSNIMTGNGSNYRASERKLANKYDKYLWTACATHRIDLMLEDLENVERFSLFHHTIKNARMVSTFP